MIIRWSSGCARATTGNRDFALNQKPVLLIHSNDANESTTFTDSGPTGHTITANGNVQHCTDQSKFGKSSIWFDGTGDYLSLADHADWNMGTGEFTIDFWVNFYDLDNEGFFSQYEDNQNYVICYYNIGKIFFQIVDANVSELFMDYAWSPSNNTWYHIAIIRGWGGNVDDWAITINGIIVKTKTDSDDWSDYAGTFYIGRAYSTSNQYLHGWMDEFHIVKGKAVWTANFTPPTRPYITWS